MDFNLSEETIMLKRTAERFLEEKCPSSLVRDLLKDELGYSRSLWKEMAELGWLGLIYDEEYGGLNGEFFDLFILFEVMGKTLLPSPFFSSAVLSGLLINEAGDEDLKKTYLPPIIEGEKILTLAYLDDVGKFDAEHPKTEALSTRNNTFALNGKRLFVPFAHIADEILLPADIKGSNVGGATLFKIQGQAEGVTKTRLETITDEKTFAVILKDTEASHNDIVGTVGKGDHYLRKILPSAVILKCGEMVGGLERIVEMTVSHVKERYQFNRPLGSLQIVQHYCADMATYLESARLIAYQAASLIGENLPCQKEIAMAKAWCSDAYRKATWMAQQVHGGIGFTEEYDLHLYYKHAKASELAFEGSWYHRSVVADELGI